jgi:ribonuclease D
LDLSSTEVFTWIKSDRELAQVCELWSSAAMLALDTEFVRTETFHAYLGLIQVCLAEQSWLIDPLTINDWQPFAAILVNPAIVKVFHSMSEDAEVLKHSVGVTIVNVFDTQIAAGFLGYPVQMSYAKLVEGLFDHVLPKEATRSDWLKRPLDDQQCEYAAADVYWLYQAYEIFAVQLRAQQRYDWVIEDCQRQVDSYAPVAPADYYLKLRGGWKLKGSRLQALKDLAAWREVLAQASNYNRGRILADKELIIIAEKMPTNRTQLQQALPLPARKIRLYGDDIIQLVKQAEATRRQDYPALIDGPLPADQADLLKTIRHHLAELAELHNLPVELLARRKALEMWLRSGSLDGQYQLPEALSGWRRGILVDSVSALINAQWELPNES